jgi:DNA-binding MarR family transcriptional regulator
MAPSLRQALSRKELANARQRMALGRMLGIADNEVLALAHLARHGTLTPSALGRLLGLSSGGATTLVQRLERGGHVVRTMNPDDGRSSLLRLTAATAQAVSQALAPLVADIDRLASDLTPDERDAITRFLGAAAEIVEDHASRLEATLEDDSEAKVTLALPGLWG